MLEPGMLRPATEAVLHTAPCAARKASAAAWVQRNGPSRLVDRIVAQNSSVSWSRSRGAIGSTVAGVPALLARKSSRPSAWMASRTMASAAPARDVAGRRDDVEPLRAQALDRRCAARIVRQMVERNFGAAARKGLDRGVADARCRAGHQRGLVAQIAHGADIGAADMRRACLFVLSGLAEQDAALHLVLLLGLDERDHHGGGLDLVILHHRVGDVLHQSALLVERAPAERIDDDFRHVLSPFGSGRSVQRIARGLTPRRRQPYGAEFASWIKRAGGDSAFRSAKRSGEGAAGWW